MIYLAISTDLLITFVLIISLFSKHKIRKQISEYKFRIYSRFAIVILLAIILSSANLFEAIYSYLNSGRISPLLNAYVNVVMIGILYTYISCKSYICDSGVWSLGVLHKWNDIQAYYFTSDRRYIVFKIKDNTIISEYKLKYRIDQESIEEINTYLSSYLVRLEQIQNV
jgi:hypothetical protein